MGGTETQDSLKYGRIVRCHVLDYRVPLTSTYALGTRFTVKIEVAGGEIKTYYNGSPTPADTLPLDGGGNYFKAGVYTQSNCTRERTCSAENFGEVAIYGVTLSHQ